MTFVEMHVKWSVTLTDRLGPEILTVLEIKGQVLHRVRLHVKVPGWLNLNALLGALECLNALPPQHDYLRAILTPREHKKPQKSRTKIHFSIGHTLSIRN